MRKIISGIKYPGVKAFIFLLTGIVIAHTMQVSDNKSIFVFLLMLLVSFSGLLIIHHFINKTYRIHYLWEIFLAIFFIISGVIVTIDKQNRSDAVLPEEEVHLLGEVISSGKETKSTYQYLVNIKSYKDTIWVNKKAKVQVYINKRSEMFPELGDEIFFLANPIEIKNYGNPGEFDYKKYCWHEGLKYQCFVQEYVKIQNRSQSFSLFVFAEKVRERLLTKIDEFTSMNRDNLPILEAMVLGYRADLDRAEKQAFSRAGIMHFMAISGLHVGIIYLILSFPLKFLRHPRLLITWKMGVILILWGYALFTGFSSSVVRATTMFTFYHIGQMLNKDHNSYNSLAWSGFFNLLVNPFQLFQTGFQLSYLAVTSILFFYPRIYKTAFFRNVILKYVWQLIAFTLSAQVLILPILAYNFKQLALLSVFTNLILTPIMFLMLAGGILYILLLSLNINFIWLGKGLDYLIDLMRNVAIVTNNISFSNVDNISMHPLQLVVIYLFIASIAMALIEKKNYTVYIAGICLCVFFLETAFKRADGLRLNQFVVFNVPGQSLYSFINGESGFVWKSEKNTSVNESNILQNYFTYKTYKETPVGINLTDDKSIANVRPIYHNHLKILQVYGSTKNWSCKHALNVDVLIISNNAWLNMDVIQSDFNPRHVIFDSSNTYTYYKKVLPYVLAKLPHANIHYVASDGAFIL